MRSVKNGESIILASSSPRRKELLDSTGLVFRVEVEPVDEKVMEGESPLELVERLAPLKAEIISKKFPDSWIIGADTVVAIRGEILGKPGDFNDAVRMLTLLSGTTHEVWTGMALLHLKRGVRKIFSSRTEVDMMSLTNEEITRYVSTKEPMDKAGAYAMQGMGGNFVLRVRGSVSNIIGLDSSRVIQELLKLNIIT